MAEDKNYDESAMDKELEEIENYSDVHYKA